MHLGIDATNIRQGGGITHLVQLLTAASPQEQGISKVTIWCNPKITPLFSEEPWLNIRSGAWMEGGSFKRFIFQHLFLSLEMRSVGCEIAFFPGSTLPLISLLPAVTISQNMLPFELEKAALFGRFSLMYIKFCVLRLLQSISFKRAIGVIFLSNYAQDKINRCINIGGLQTLIPHGIESRFIGQVKIQKPIEAYSMAEPFRFLYVSILMPYKHQIEVIRAIKELRDSGMPVVLDLIGPSWGWYGRRVMSLILKFDPQNIYMRYLGEIPYKLLPSCYHNCDAFIFASSCENFPNILIEAMASGAPIASSKNGPMPGIMMENGFYLNPKDINSIKFSLRHLLTSFDSRGEMAKVAYQNSKKYSWEDCAKNTWQFIVECSFKIG